MSDNSSNSTASDRSLFASGRPDRIKSALQSKNQPTNAAGHRPQINTPHKNANAYTDAQNASGIPTQQTGGGKIQSGQRSQIGAGPKRKASDNLSEILSRQRLEKKKPRTEHVNNMANSANDDIAHAAQLLEEIKSDTSKKPIMAAGIFTVAWVTLCIAIGLSLFNSGIVATESFSFTSIPVLFSIAAVLFVPCVLSWGVAVFLYRARELHQISLSLAYTALHLTQPEDMASESIATIGQAVRREVAAMGDGIDRAISRATLLESKFRNEVGNIQGFYKNNESIFNKIILDLEKERDLMSATGDDLEERLPKMLDGLKESSFDFSNIVQSADERFSALAATADDRLASLSSNIEEKNKALQLGLDNTVENVMRVASTLDVGTDTLGGVAEKLVNISEVAFNKLETVSEVAAARLENVSEGAASRLENVSENATARFENVSEGAAVRLENVSGVAVSRLENVSENFDRHTADIQNATTAIVQANDEISLALKSRHENLSSSAEHLLENAEQINNLLSSFALVIDKSFMNAEDRSQTMQTMLREAAQESAEILHEEMSNIRKSTSSETLKLIELLKESSFTATTALREDIQSVIGGSQNEVAAALTMLLKESQSMGDNLRNEAHSLTEMMQREVQAVRDNTVGNTEETLNQIRQQHEASIADIIGRIEQAGDKLTGTAENLNLVTGRMDTEMEAARTGLAEVVAQMPAEAKQALTDMQSYIDDQVKAMSELARTVGGLGTVVATPLPNTAVPRASMPEARIAEARKAEAKPTNVAQNRTRATAPPKTTARRQAEMSHEALGGHEPRPASRPSGMTQKRATNAPTRQAAPRREAVRTETNIAPHRDVPQPGTRAAAIAQSRSTKMAQPQNTARQNTAPQNSGQPVNADGRQRMARQKITPQANVTPVDADATSKNKWEMPDLLSRASSNQTLPEHLQPRAEAPRPTQNRRGQQNELHSVESLNALSLDLAKALDHEAPDQLWTRYRNGERNVFTRRLYTMRGQKLFDEVGHKYRTEAAFSRDVDRYIGDFEELLTKIYEQDRDSMLIDTYLSSETGKVYLMLAHASGRLD